MHWVGEIFVFELFVMPRYRGNREYRGVRSTPPPRQIATPPDTPAPDYGGWDPAADYEWSAPIAMEEDG